MTNVKWLMSNDKGTPTRSTDTEHIRTTFIYTDSYADYDYGLAHPLKIVRLKLTYKLIKDYE